MHGSITWFRAYLQGIETQTEKEFQEQTKKFRAYLQGIETQYPHIIGKRFKSFEPTYKELKHFTSAVGHEVTAKFRAYLQGIETMEGGEESGGEAVFRAYLQGIETCSWSDS